MLVRILGNPVQSHSAVENLNRDKNGASGVHQNAQYAQILQYKGFESLVFNTALKDSYGATRKKPDVELHHQTEDFLCTFLSRSLTLLLIERRPLADASGYDVVHIGDQYALKKGRF